MEFAISIYIIDGDLRLYIKSRTYQIPESIIDQFTLMLVFLHQMQALISTRISLFKVLNKLSLCRLVNSQ
ncbi:hypothetical protein FGO68_gene16281 [Halteria grandinella]|uniref:Uncharacterized protein n=1 Tax=Halteria grandinella TaxID=5974 RepID=A0A8J8SYC3_HALGN|nr:hypothetical protein FGO68_gene16281 [Halteria grandinella]